MKWNKIIMMIIIAGISALWLMCASSKPNQTGMTKEDEKKKVDELLDQGKTDEKKQEDDVLKLLGIPTEDQTKAKETQTPISDKEKMEKQATDLENQLKGKDTEISKLKSNLENSNQKLTELEGVLNELKTTPTKSEVRTAPTNLTSSSSGDYKTRYESALNEYRQKNYNYAIRAFEQLLSTDANNSYSDNCRYWIGESYYGLMDYQRALIEFEKVFAFVNSNKEDAAQLKIGLCYKQLNQTDNARNAFQRFIMKYPDSEYIELARNFLAEL